MKEKKKLKRNDKYRYHKGSILSKYGLNGKEVAIINRPNGADKTEWADTAKKITLHLNMHHKVGSKADRRNGKLQQRITELQQANKVLVASTAVSTSLAFMFLVGIFLQQL